MYKRSYTSTQARIDLPFRKKKDNKTRGGKCLVIAGAAGQWGAAVLCATAAARCGAGYTFILDFKKSFPTLNFPDFLISSQMKSFSSFASIALGPGLKDKGAIRRFISELIRTKCNHVVLDAEALNVIAQSKKEINLPQTWILTPHEGEMARLLKTSSEKIKKEREASVLKLQRKLGCIILLKGSPTLVTDGLHLYKIISGNPSLAKAGTGDVLTGMIAGLLSQKLNPVKAACLGAYLHGFIADEWIRKKKDHLTLLASDLTQNIPHSIARLRNFNSRQ